MGSSERLEREPVACRYYLDHGFVHVRTTNLSQRVIRAFQTAIAPHGRGRDVIHEPEPIARSQRTGERQINTATNGRRLNVGCPSSAQRRPGRPVARGSC
jgi:hypothetical protein